MKEKAANVMFSKVQKLKSVLQKQLDRFRVVAFAAVFFLPDEDTNVGGLMKEVQGVESAISQ